MPGKAKIRRAWIGLNSQCVHGWLLLIRRLPIPINRPGSTWGTMYSGANCLGREKLIGFGRFFTYTRQDRAGTARRRARPRLKGWFDSGDEPSPLLAAGQAFRGCVPPQRQVLPPLLYKPMGVWTARPQPVREFRILRVLPPDLRDFHSRSSRLHRWRFRIFDFSGARNLFRVRLSMESRCGINSALPIRRHSQQIRLS